MVGLFWLFWTNEFDWLVRQDATMKVSVEVLKRVYESLQDQGERTQVEKEFIDPENHLFFIDAFEMPRWTWSQERGTFERYVLSHAIIYPGFNVYRSSVPSTSSGSPESRVTAFRDRLHIIKQCVLRNEHFAPSTLPSRETCHCGPVIFLELVQNTYSMSSLNLQNNC
jgi:DNA polymerase epsilon subunit 2